jgi:hypothetical protein
MIDVARLAQGAIQGVLADRAIVIKKYLGVARNVDGERVPTYTTINGLGNVQALSSTALGYAEKMGLQGELLSVYSLAPNFLTGSMQGATGGDLITVDGADWLVITLVESYPTYCHAIIQRQVV